MSGSVRRRISAEDECRKCLARFWRLFPHLLLSLSLVAYAALGALMFQHIEGESASTGRDNGSASIPQDYRQFLSEVVSTVQNLTDNSSFTHDNITREVEIKMRYGFKSIWLQRPDRWSFFGSMFFCCTVFTTVAVQSIPRAIALANTPTSSAIADTLVLPSSLVLPSPPLHNDQVAGSGERGK